MKELILISITLFLQIMIAGAQTGYEVYKATGRVEIYVNDGWAALSRKDSVVLKDRLRLADSSRVGILDNTSMRIYYSEKVGEQTVAGIISSAKKNSDGIVRQMNRQIKEAMTGEEKGISYSSVGASHRGLEENDFTESLYSFLAGIIEKGDFCVAADDSTLVLHKVQIDDGEFSFSIENRNDCPLCVNVLAMDRDSGRNTLCFDVGYSYDEPYLIVPSQSIATVSQYVFSETREPDTCYLLFATEEPFDTQMLQMLINNDAELSRATGIQQKVKLAVLSTDR